MERRIRILAHNIRSLWNIGTFFRTGDAFAVEKIYLTGYTATPPRREISKTAIGAEKWIPWEYLKDPLEGIEVCKKEGFTVVSLEKTQTSVTVDSIDLPSDILLVLGQEVLGVPEELLRVSDHIVHIPMMGKKSSLNVSVAAGIALAQLRS